jgi:hypothetical protein
VSVFKIEMKVGQEQRLVDADRFSATTEEGWIIFYRKPPTGGIVEYWRARLEHVVSMETIPGTGTA